ncbi:hypothetical protein BP6252_12612 [Coleophoma cylindrospora]|uniref:Uncharacterized protein n=1 Tax=Coleophoma cylindrospora TaxID=1849047 RepID=A0A3D8QCE3_9HELO|nr:hypothetical protein BP6252_12612 [Coleophoma cylindrospora]
MAQTPQSPSYALHSIAVAYGLAYLPNYYSTLRLAAAAPSKFSFAMYAKTKPRRPKTPPLNPALEPMLPRAVRAPECLRRLPTLCRLDVSGNAHAAAERRLEPERRAVFGAARAVYGPVCVYGEPDFGVGEDGGLDFGRGGAVGYVVEGGECGEGGGGLVRGWVWGLGCIGIAWYEGCIAWAGHGIESCRDGLGLEFGTGWFC